MAKKRPAPSRDDVPHHLLTRHARIRVALQHKRLDGILLTTAADLAYVTGHAWEDTFGVLTHDRLTLVSDFRYQTQLADWSGWATRVIRPTKQSMSEAVADVVIASKAKRLGFEANHLSFAETRRLQAKLKERTRRVPPAKLAPLEGFMVDERKVKDALEIAAIRRAVEAAEGAYLAVRPELKAGLSENDIAGRLEYEMRRRGASAGSFETNVSIGPASALPHYRPGDTRLRGDEALLFDWGARVDNYCSDITRTHFFGSPPAKLREVYHIVLHAQQSAIAAIRPGVTTRKVDAAARDIIRKAGYAKDFGHGLGHGIGLVVHELPRLSPAAADLPLLPGMVVTVEPGIYLAGLGGVRIEDDVLVTERGCEVLTSLDKSYEGACLE